MDKGDNPRIRPSVVVAGEDFGQFCTEEVVFKLRQAKSAISALDDGAMRPNQVKTISERLKVTERDVMDMDRRLRGDVSLNSRSNDAIEAGDALDRLVDPSPSHDIEPAETEELTRRRGALEAALQTLSPRERHIFTARYLTETPPNSHACDRVRHIGRAHPPN